ncbi:hypothetical protein L6164_037526 [Bauhinia variegata]|uniref:Uncharacterized protein n=1 Tax=Bauhinia variegata TaxID=167791 RepID=A0ACB9KK97_BAUVA|nr:hypothetical protein L6164_037526 [Bauhinia variegata]
MGRNGLPVSSLSSLATVWVVATELTESSSWWNDVNKSPIWQDRIFHVLDALYGIVAAAALPEIVQHILLDMPSLAFFKTYALLVLFWAEIYYQARAVLSTDGLRPSFYSINAVVYAIQVKIIAQAKLSGHSCGLDIL